MKTKTYPWRVKNGKVKIRGTSKWMTPTELLRAAKEQILKFPESYMQETTCSTKHSCGTMACIGGWMWIIATNDTEPDLWDVSAFLTGKPRWPDMFEAASLYPLLERFGDRSSPLMRSHAAALLIEAFIHENYGD